VKGSDVVGARRLEIVLVGTPIDIGRTRIPAVRFGDALISGRPRMRLGRMRLGRMRGGPAPFSAAVFVLLRLREHAARRQQKQAPQ
jgi:hypothetical protein